MNKDIPASHGRDKHIGTSGNYTAASQRSLAHCQVPVGTGNEPVGNDDGQEHDDVSNVHAQRADQVDEVQHAHKKHDVGVAGFEGRLSKAVSRRGSGRRRVRAPCIIEGLQRCGEGRPVGTEGTEDCEVEGAAEDELEDAADGHKDTTEEEGGAAVRRVLVGDLDGEGEGREGSLNSSDPRRASGASLNGVGIATSRRRSAGSAKSRCRGGRERTLMQRHRRRRPASP